MLLAKSSVLQNDLTFFSVGDLYASWKFSEFRF